MSIKLMSAAWTLPIPITEKMVLLCICDHANDHGSCWPAVSTLAKKCSCSDRTVQRAIKSLCDANFLWIKEAIGKPHTYQVNIDALFDQTHDTVSPPTESHPRQKVTTGVTHSRRTPDTVSPKPSITINEPSIVKRGSPSPAKPDGVDAQVWSDFLAVRKSKRAPLTETAMKAIEREAVKAGVTLAQAIETCAERGWQSFKADWLAKQQPQRQSGNFGFSAMVAASERRAALRK
jgi:hypothetical protein